MDIWLLTFETTLTLLLLTALGAALLGKTRRRWLYWLLLVPWLLCCIVGRWWVVVLVATSARERFIYPTYIEHSVVMALLLTIGGLGILIAGNRRREGRLTGGVWPARRLFLACLVAMLLQAVTLYRVNTGISSELVATRARINHQYAALLKPVDRSEPNAVGLYSQAFVQIKATLVAADSADARRVDDQPKRSSEAWPGGFGGGPAWTMGAVRTSPSDLISEGNVTDPRIPPIIKSLEPAIRTLHAASLRPVCRFNQIDEPPDVMMKMPWLGSFRSAAILLRCHAELEARSGRIDSALADIAAIHRLARHTSQTEVWMLSGLVAIGVDAIGYTTLADVLPYANSPVRLPEGMAPTESQLHGNIRRTLAGEEAFGTRVILEVCDGRPANLGGPPIPTTAVLAYRMLFARADLRALRELFAAANDRLEGKPVNLSRGPSGRPLSGLLTQIMMPQLSRLFETIYPNGQASSRAAEVAVAVTNYRIETGDYPASLNELVPKYIVAVPSDPFDGKPMRYVLKDGQATIYSVGQDRVDDGGQLKLGTDQPYRRTLDVGLMLKKPVTPANPS